MSKLAQVINVNGEDYDVKDELLSRVNRYGEKVHFKKFWIEDFNGYKTPIGKEN